MPRQRKDTWTFRLDSPLLYHNGLTSVAQRWERIGLGTRVRLEPNKK